MANPEDSTKAPPKIIDTWSNKFTLKYTAMSGSRGACGETTMKHSDRSDVGSYSWQKIEATGSCSTLSADSEEKQNSSSLNVGNMFDYVADGKSSQTDGHIDENTMSTWRRNAMGDVGESGQKSLITYTNGGAHVYGAAKSEIVTGESSTFSGVGTFGDQVNEHSGNWHEAFEKDHVQAVKGNKITMVEGGDHALHVQSGNYDAHIQQKGRIYSESDLLLESASKITLKVGASTIVITAGSIEMDSPAIFLN
jgi:hypothetical protein